MPDRPRLREAATPSSGGRPRSDITVTLRCNNQCRFCPRPTLRHISVRSAEDLDARLRAVRRHSRRVVLTGGEVTIHAELVDWIDRCRRLGFEQIGIITNARALADAERARRLVDAGLTEACVTVYDLRAAVHDQLTGAPGSLEESLLGLDQLLALAGRGESLLVRVNTLLCAANADGLQPMLQELCRRGVRRFLVGDVMLSETYPEPLDHQRVIELLRAVGDDSLLREASVAWRGFPLCLARDLPGVRIEPHDVDTALVDDSDLDRYFTEFGKLFVRAEPCARCSAAGRCLGPQRRYVAELGHRSLRTLTTIEAASVTAGVGDDDPLERARQELAEFSPWPESGRLEVMPTTACPFRCTYCKVELGDQHASPQVLDRAVDLLLSSKRDQLELQFFGGEPLLRRQEVLRTMARAARIARERDKRLRFVITTSGLPLSAELLQELAPFDVKVMMSVDGPADVMAEYRPHRSAQSPDLLARLESNLRMLVASGVDYFVNMVVTPADAAAVPERLRYLAGLGAKTVQICYALMPGWSDAAQEAFCVALRRCADLVADTDGLDLRLQNLGSAAEPTVLSTDMIVDVDGTVYGDAALFAEKVFPGLRGAFRIGHVDELSCFDGIRRSRERNLVDLRRTYPDPASEPRRILEEQLRFGRRIQATLDEIERPGQRRPRRAAPTGGGERPGFDENPLQRAVLRRGLAHQAKVMRQRPQLLSLPILMLENPCFHDCLFCVSKPLPPTSLEAVRRWLRDNRSLRLRRLGIAGNEPLAHPSIDGILAAAAAVGFERIEVLTSGVALADPRRAEQLYAARVKGYGIPLYAADAAAHDCITQSPGSHADTVRGIENLLKLGATVHVHANLLRQNLDGLAALAELVERRWGLPLCVIPVRPKAANLPYGELVPRYDDIAERASVDCLVGFPLCVAGRVQHPALPSGDIISDVLKLYVLDQPFVKPAKCRSCRWLDRCSGTFQAYLDLYGDGELRPAHH
ncbi:MAG: radical SAM protein [Deltaproteobacteria bacterium]|jgi:MoaA/NifB/PqqE/SkfB family radical SAM enzyme|nr:radical SAM protein [Deltaproteobacteria bacterium]MBW2533230.1 radical SAM protein [Deltaproteobacteria bacterium]